MTRCAAGYPVAQLGFRTEHIQCKLEHGNIYMYHIARKSDREFKSGGLAVRVKTAKLKLPILFSPTMYNEYSSVLGSFQPAWLHNQIVLSETVLAHNWVTAPHRLGLCIWVASYATGCPGAQLGKLNIRTEHTHAALPSVPLCELYIYLARC